MGMGLVKLLKSSISTTGLLLIQIDLRMLSLIVSTGEGWVRHAPYLSRPILIHRIYPGRLQRFFFSTSAKIGAEICYQTHTPATSRPSLTNGMCLTCPRSKRSLIAYRSDAMCSGRSGDSLIAIRSPFTSRSNRARTFSDGDCTRTALVLHATHISSPSEC
jgi:hypothetical protein